MSDFKRIAEMYAESEADCDMSHLTKLTSCFVDEMKTVAPAQTEKFLCDLELYVCPFGSRKLAEKAAAGFKNKDGTTGAHWKYEDVEDVARKHNVEPDEIPEFYFVLNMMYSDYAKQSRTVEDYVELAMDFIDDKDAPADKAARYFRAMRY